MKIEAGRADINQLVRPAIEKMQEGIQQRRQVELSGHASDLECADSLAIAQTSAPARAGDPFNSPQTCWKTISMPYGLPPITVYGDPNAAARNRWSLHELMVRRMRKAFCTALVNGKICHVEDAKRRAMRCAVHVVDVDLAVAR